MTGIADNIMQRAAVHDSRRSVCMLKSSLDLGSREAVDQTLSCLAKPGCLRRAGHGLYDVPRISNVLNCPAPVDLDAAITALARRDSVRNMPNGLVAANQLGLTNAVPPKANYMTDGHSWTLVILGRIVRFWHLRPNVMQWAGRPAVPVVQELR